MWSDYAGDPTQFDSLDALLRQFLPLDKRHRENNERNPTRKQIVLMLADLSFIPHPVYHWPAQYSGDIIAAIKLPATAN
ncbi:hypothetical protein BLNAU_14095 [Blattamonas nauphoetae]|uniref:Uncharacterized protein n=1 Tax=Blattamonas nauphoetae TaxID=2049346 RepID=A0ABQ9XGA2_9EUKA|nr:hypothetical protein BLNAU_14095 [Blattamonas nauphoetae]